MEQHEENQWIRRAQAGDRQAFALLADRYWVRVQRWLQGMVHDRHVAEDLTQEAFLKAWTGLASLQTTATFRTWLFRIARNCLIDNRRNPKAAALPRLPEGAATREPGPEDVARLKEGQVLLQQACQHMPDEYRAPYLLWTQEELPYTDIAQVLGITEETARWRVCKARQTLVKALDIYLDKKL